MNENGLLTSLNRPDSNALVTVLSLLFALQFRLQFKYAVKYLSKIKLFKKYNTAYKINLIIDKIKILVINKI